MKTLIRFLLFALLTGLALHATGCSEDSQDEGNRTETSDNGDKDDGYVFQKTIEAYSGNEIAVTSALIKIYRKNSSYYARLGNTGEYTLCSPNPGYKSSYTGRDPKKKYRYCVKFHAMTYYFDL